MEWLMIALVAPMMALCARTGRASDYHAEIGL